MDPAGPAEFDRPLHGDEPTRDVAADVIRARQALEQARDELDLALAVLPQVDCDKAMATPALLSLLLGAVTAKNHLKYLEALMVKGPAEAKHATIAD